MRIRLFAILILTAWAQVRSDEPPPDPPGQEITIGLGLGPQAARQRKPTRITLIIPEPSRASDDDEAVFVQQQHIRRIDLHTAIVKSENFDRVVFGDENEMERQSHLDELLMLQAGRAVRLSHLNIQERTKLILAGKGDIKRFFDQVENRRQEFERTRKGFQEGLASLKRLRDISQLYQDGPFGEGSLFTKTLRKIEADRKADDGKADVTLGL